MALRRWGIIALLANGCSGAEPPVEPGMLSVTATDFAFAAPDSIPGGLVTIRLVNEGALPHHIVLMRVPAGRTFEAARAAVEESGELPAWLETVGGPELTTDPATDPTFITWLEEGEYILACALAIGTPVPHFRLGMMRPLVVTPPAGERRTIAARDTIGLYEFNFAIADTVAAGRVRFRIENRGTVAHHAEVMRVAPGIDLAGVLAALEDPDAPELVSIGGFTGVLPAADSWMELTLTPGRHVLVCFLRSAVHQTLHHRLGMVRMFEVR